MRRAAFTPGVLLAGVLLFASVAGAQGDLAKALVGTWLGEVQALGQGNREDPHRTLIIRSVRQAQGTWAGEGRFGVTGKGLAPVHLEVDPGGAHPSIRFVTRADATVRLELLDEAHLAGTLSRREMGGHFGNDRAIRLEKQKE